MRWLALLAVLFAGCGASAVGTPQQQLSKVDDFPLYELTDTRPTPSLYAQTDATGWACTVFMSSGGGRPMLGRNFDFHDEPALVLHHHPPNAYRSVSLVDISYLGVDREHLEAEAVAVGYAAALDAHYLGDGSVGGQHVARQLIGTVLKDNPDDGTKLKHYFDVVVKPRAKRGSSWKGMMAARDELNR